MKKIIKIFFILFLVKAAGIRCSDFVNITITVKVQNYSISGNVYYLGTETGKTLYIEVFDNEDLGGEPVASISKSDFTSPYSYTITNLIDGTYWVFAYLDINGNNSYEEFEPFGKKPVEICGENAENADITINTKPDKPTCISPKGNDIPLELFLIASEFSDSNEGDTQIATEWEIFLFEQAETDTPVFHHIIGLAQIALNPNLSFNQVQVPWGILKTSTQYKWRVRYKDTYGPEWSEWSDFTSFTTVSEDTEYENQQVTPPEEITDPNVKGAVLSETTNNETIVFACEKNIIVKSIDPDTLPDEGKPDNLPFGLFSIRIGDLAEDETTVLVTFYIPGNYEGGCWYKYDPVLGWYRYQDAFFTYNSSTGYTKVDVIVEDGGNGDADGEKNGVIVDPSGPTSPPPPPSGGGGGCFIATAAFGSPLAKQIEILREFRDKYLLTNYLGKKFVSWYYKNTPKVAKFISMHLWAKFLTKIILYPTIAFVYLIIKGLLAPVILLFSSIYLLRIKIAKF